MMNLEKSIRFLWDMYSDLNLIIPKERVTSGPPGKGVVPYLTIDIDRWEPALLVNSGYLRENVDFCLNIRHHDYVECRLFVDYLQNIVKGMILYDTDSGRYAHLQLLETRLKRMEDRTWLVTMKMVAEVYLTNECEPAI